MDAQPTHSERNRPGVVIIGAGPAGLTAAYELARLGMTSTVLEADPVVGGLSRTIEYKGYLFDIGGHRFFTKVSLVEKIWREILGDDLLLCPRLSRIYYRGRYFRYPLEALDAVRGLGIAEAAHCALSFVKAHLFPRSPEEDFETYIVNRFGRRLFETFFKSYTEKVWGIPCDRIRADWATQRIRGLSFGALLRNSFEFGSSDEKQRVIRTLTHQFLYPRRGPGMMWESMKKLVEKNGARVLLDSPVDKVCWRPGAVEALESGGRSFPASHVISSMPIRCLVRALDPAPPEEVAQAASRLNYRDFMIVALMARKREVFPDNWIYIHEPGVRVGRVQNFKNWSPEMTPDPETTCLGMEYFCSQGDDLWEMDDDKMIALAKSEAGRIGLVDPGLIDDGVVLRVPKAYPVYDETYADALAVVRRFFEGVPNLQLVGRNGMHRYNNQDHSMLSAIFAARNIRGGHYDLWNVNVDEEYHEDGYEINEAELHDMHATQPQIPRAI